LKRKRYMEEQIAIALRQHESGTAVEEILRKMGISEPTFYRWKKKYAGTGAPSIPSKPDRLPEFRALLGRPAGCRQLT
jgi:transposase-like protein